MIQAICRGSRFASSFAASFTLQLCYFFSYFTTSCVLSLRPGSHLTLVSALPEDHVEPALCVYCLRSSKNDASGPCCVNFPRVPHAGASSALQEPHRSLRAHSCALQVGSALCRASQEAASGPYSDRVDPHGNATNHGIGGMWRSMGCSEHIRAFQELRSDNVRVVNATTCNLHDGRFP